MEATLDTGPLKATVRFHELKTGGVRLDEFECLAALLASMAENWSGSEAEFGWMSVDADIDLTATSDGLGHVVWLSSFAVMSTNGRPLNLFTWTRDSCPNCTDQMLRCL